MLPIDCRRGLQRPHERGEEVHIRKGTGDDLLHCMRVSYTERAFPLQEYGQERVTAGVVFHVPLRCCRRGHRGRARAAAAGRGRVTLRMSLLG